MKFVCIDCQKGISKKSKYGPVPRRCSFCKKAKKKKYNREYMRLWNAKNPEKVKKWASNWYSENRKNNSAWRAENKRRAKAWRAKNREHIREYDAGRERAA